MNKTEIEGKYKDVENSLENAINVADNIKLSGDEEIEELKAVKNSLASMNESFKKEINKLESSSEWDKFCLAFFGETNAGKSTIVESLRIIYDEESRRSKIVTQQKEYADLLNEHIKDFEKVVESIKSINDSLQHESKTSIAKWIIFWIIVFILGIGVGLALGHSRIFN